MLARGLLLCVALLCSLAIAEAVCARWVSWSRRSTAVPVGGLGINERSDTSPRFAQPLQQINLRSNFPDPPGDHEIDLVVMGSSSAQGVPYDRWVSIGKIVAWKLEEAIPGRPIHLNVIARAGDTLEMQHKILSNVSRRPDLLIIYSGHNEFYSRLWWARNIDHYLDDKRPSRWAVVVERIEQYSPLCILIRESADRCRIALPPPSDIHQELVDVPNFTAIEYTTILTDFRRRLEELVSHAEQVGAMPVLILPPANDADFEPNRSFLAPTTPRHEREAFGRVFLAARRPKPLILPDAIKQLHRAILRAPILASRKLVHRLSHLLEQKGEWDEAYEQYIAASCATSTECRCVAPARSRRFTVRWPRFTAASDRRAILLSCNRPSRSAGRRSSFRMRCTRRCAGRSRWHKRSWARSTRGRRLDGPKTRPYRSLILPNVSLILASTKTPGTNLAMWWKGFNELMSPLRYDRDLRSRKREAIAAVAKIDAGVAPEAVGLPNLGIPARIPLILKQLDPAPSTTQAVLPCLTR